MPARYIDCVAEAVSLSSSGAGGRGSETAVWLEAADTSGIGLNFLKAERAGAVMSMRGAGRKQKGGRGGGTTG